MRVTNRAASLLSWHDDWQGLTVLVAGLGEAGFSAADTLAELGSSVLVLTDEPDAERERILGVLGVAVLLVGSSVPEADLVIVPTHESGASDALLGVVESARAAGALVWSDLELAWRLRDKITAEGPSPVADWLLVAGAGAELVALLTERMLVLAGRRALACGAERPVLDAIRYPEPFDQLVIAATAEQLAGASTLSPRSSALLSADAAEAVAWPQGRADFESTLGQVYSETREAAIYLREDAMSEEQLREAEVVEGCRAIGVIRGVPGPSDLGVVEGILCDRAFLDDRRNSALELAELSDLEESGLGGALRLQQVLVAAALARSADVDPSAVRDAVREPWAERLPGSGDTPAA